MKKIVILSVALLALCSACKKQGLEPVTIQQLTELSELGTVEYTVTKVVKATDNKNVLAVFGSRKIIFNTKSTLKAGFDMSELTAEDVVCKPEQKEISLTLPAPKLLSLNMKPEDITVAYEESTGFRRSFTPEERNALQVQAEADIRASMAELGILDDAKKYAKEFFESFLKQCGYETINIDFKNNEEVKI